MPVEDIFLLIKITKERGEVRNQPKLIRIRAKTVPDKKTLGKIPSDSFTIY